MLNAIKELVAIPSVSGSAEVKTALQKALAIAESLGMRVKNCDDIVGYAEIGDGEEMMGILCHLDVVPAGDGWARNPFLCEMRDSKIYGRGTMDDKGPAMAALYAMKDVMDSEKVLGKRVRIIFGCREESGEWDDMDYYKAHEEIPSFGFTPDADYPAIYGEKGILMLDLSMKSEDSGFLELDGGDVPNMVADWARAVLWDGSKIETVGEAAHGSTPEQGVNAITRLMEKAALNGCEFAKFYMEKIGWDLSGEKIGIGLHDKASGGLTLNVGKVSLSDGEIHLQVDIRYPVTFSKEDVMERLKNEVAPYDVSVNILTELPPVYMDKNGEVITNLMEAYREVTDDDTPPQVMGGGTYARAMDNIVAFGPVFPGRECTEHTKNEWIYVEDLEKSRAIYALAIEKLACR